MSDQSLALHGTSSAVLSVSLALLQQVVQQHLFRNQESVRLAPALPQEASWQYAAELTSCALSAGSEESFFLFTFGFQSVRVAGPGPAGELLAAQLACRVTLVAYDDPAGPALRFHNELLLESPLRSSAAAPAWFSKPASRNAVSLELLAELEVLLAARLPLNLCRLALPIAEEGDLLPLGGSSAASYEVVAGPKPRLDIHYQADSTPYAYGLATGIDDPFTAESANVSLLIGNEHLLRKLVLPALYDFYADNLYRTITDENAAAFAQLFDLASSASLADDTSLRMPDALRASNRVPLQPRYPFGGTTTSEQSIRHLINIGDLVVEIGQFVRVDVIYTLVLPNSPVLPSSVIKIRHTYSFQLDPGGQLFEWKTGDSKLDIWGETTNTETVFEQLEGIISGVSNSYALQKVATELCHAVLWHLASYLQPPWPAPPQVPALPGQRPQPSWLPTVAFGALTLVFYQLKNLNFFSPTVIPDPEDKERSHRSKPIALTKETHDKLDELLVAQRTSDNLPLDFFTYLVRDFALAAVVWSGGALAARYGYGGAVSYASLLLRLDGVLKQQFLKYSGVGTTTNALLARQFYGDDYLTRVLHDTPSREGLRCAVSGALLPLFRGAKSKVITVLPRPHGMYVLLSVEGAAIPLAPLVAGPHFRRPARAEVLPASAKRAQYLIQQEVSKRFALDMAALEQLLSQPTPCPSPKETVVPTLDAMLEEDINSGLGLHAFIAAVGAQAEQQQARHLIQLETAREAFQTYEESVRATLITDSLAAVEELGSFAALVKATYPVCSSAVSQVTRTIKNSRVLRFLEPRWWQDKGGPYQDMLSALAEQQENLVAQSAAAPDKQGTSNNPLREYQARMRRLTKMATQLSSLCITYTESLQRATYDVLATNTNGHLVDWSTPPNTGPGN